MGYGFTVGFDIGWLASFTIGQLVEFRLLFNRRVIMFHHGFIAQLLLYVHLRRLLEALNGLHVGGQGLVLYKC